MPKFQGQTDSVLKIKLPSSIVAALWGDSEVAQGGRISLEVRTQWVAEGSDIEIAIKDLEGGAVETVKGKVYSDVFRMQYMVSKPNKTGGMFFEAELKAHGLKAPGPKARVWPGVKISEVKILDAAGKELKEVEEAVDLGLEAKIEGAPPGTPCRLTLLAEKHSGHRLRCAGIAAKVEGTKASGFLKRGFTREEIGFEGHVTLARNAEDYEVPKLIARAECLGVAGESAPIPFVSFVEFDFLGRMGKATLILPDGTEKTEDVPEGGILRIDKPKAGRFRLKEFVATGDDGKPAGPEVLPGEDEDSDSESDSNAADGHS